MKVWTIKSPSPTPWDGDEDTRTTVTIPWQQAPAYATAECGDRFVFECSDGTYVGEIIDIEQETNEDGSVDGWPIHFWVEGR